MVKRYVAEPGNDTSSPGNAGGETWVTPKLSSAVKLTGYGGITLYTQPLGNLSATVKLSVETGTSVEPCTVAGGNDGCWITHYIDYVDNKGAKQVEPYDTAEKSNLVKLHASCRC